MRAKDFADQQYFKAIFCDFLQIYVKRRLWLWDCTDSAVINLLIESFLNILLEYYMLNFH